MVTERVGVLSLYFLGGEVGAATNLNRSETRTETHERLGIRHPARLSTFSLRRSSKRKAERRSTWENMLLCGARETVGRQWYLQFSGSQNSRRVRMTQIQLFYLRKRQAERNNLTCVRNMSYRLCTLLIPYVNRCQRPGVEKTVIWTGV
jgi:hypothetical protein